MNQLGQFEQNLLTELREVVAEQADTPPPRRGLPLKRLTFATAGVGLLAAGIVFGVPAMSGDQTPAAYAVATNGDGTVTITVNRVEDPEGLERELSAHGIKAQVDFTPPQKECVAPRYDLAQNPSPTNFMRIAGGGDTLTLRPAEVRGKTLLVDSQVVTPPTDTTEAEYVIAYLIVAGPVPPCVLGDVEMAPGMG